MNMTWHKSLRGILIRAVIVIHTSEMRHLGVFVPRGGWLTSHPPRPSVNPPLSLLRVRGHPRRSARLVRTGSTLSFSLSYYWQHIRFLAADDAQEPPRGDNNRELSIAGKPESRCCGRMNSWHGRRSRFRRAYDTAWMGRVPPIFIVFVYQYTPNCCFLWACNDERAVELDWLVLRLWMLLPHGHLDSLILGSMSGVETSFTKEPSAWCLGGLFGRGRRIQCQWIKTTPTSWASHLSATRLNEAQDSQTQ